MVDDRPIRPLQPLGILAVALFLAGGMWALLIYELAHDRAGVEAAAARNVGNLARAFEEHVRRTVGVLDQALLHLREELEASPDELPQEFERTLRHLPPDFVSQVGLIDAAGRLAFSNLGRPSGVVDLSDREHYRVHRDSGEDKLFISKPVLGRVSGKWSIQFTRRMTDADGHFDGVLVLSVDPAFFSDFFRSIDVGERGAITLAGMDRVIRARAANVGGKVEPMGMEIPDRPFFSPAQPDQGVYTMNSAVDGLLRIGGWRRMTEYPLVVLVLLAHDEIFAAFEQRRGKLLLGGFAATLLIALSTIAAFRLVNLRQAYASKLQAQADELKRSNVELEAFAYAASHDLREPLRMVNSFLALLERRANAKLDQDEREFVAFARDGAQRMDRLILDLLDYSRVGRRERPFARVELKQAVDLALRNLYPQIEEARATVEVAPDLPAILGDAEELARLFQNLIGNAVKYREPSRPLRIAIDARRRGETWNVTVRDNGIGIPPEHHDRIFAIFQRLHGRGEQEGSGIGLALCRKIAQHHGGRIWVRSEPGRGSAFTVCFPANFGGRVPCGDQDTDAPDDDPCAPAQAEAMPS